MPNLYFPPEWQEQQAILLTWPHKFSDWRQRLSSVEKVFSNLCQILDPLANLLIIAYDENHLKHIQTFLPTCAHVEYLVAPTNDTWIRDYGPITVFKNHKPYMLNFEFNGWGKKFAADLDNKINNFLNSSHLLQSYKLLQMNKVLEGGSIETDGQGLMITTTNCLLKRNSLMNKKDYEALFKEQLGIHTVWWIENAYLSGDDTDSHIDNFVRFISPTQLCYLQSKDSKDEHHAILQAMEKELKSYCASYSRAIDLIPLPLPHAIYIERKRVAASYINFLITNGAVIVPTFGVREDEHALNILREALPTYRIQGVYALPLVTQGGGIHCSTMQIPRLPESSLFN